MAILLKLNGKAENEFQVTDNLTQEDLKCITELEKRLSDNTRKEIALVAYNRTSKNRRSIT